MRAECSECGTAMLSPMPVDLCATCLRAANRALAERRDAIRHACGKATGGRRLDDLDTTAAVMPSQS